MFNKKGQREMSIGTLLAIIVGVVAVVVVILFFTGTFDKLGSGGEVIPGTLEAATQGCKLAVQGSLVSSYCYEFKKLSDEEYVNCEDARIKDALSQQGADVNKITCTGSDRDKLVNDARIDICKSIRPSRLDEVRVGGKLCSSFTCEDHGMIEAVAPVICEESEQLKLSGNVVCCPA
jgi:hypothetical protein